MSPAPPAVPSPLERYLQDPWGTVQAVASSAAGWAGRWWPVAVPAVLAVTAMVLGAVGWSRRRRTVRLATGARVISVQPPPQVDPAGTAAIWSNLVGLLRPAWRRTVGGQPHLAFEYLFDATGMRVQLWVPGPVPPGLVERAVEAAWPGARTSTAPAGPDGPLGVPAGKSRRRDPELVAVAGGELRLAFSEALPLRTDFDADPLRALIGAATGLDTGQRAVVQILTRPVTGRRVARARRSGRRLQSGRSPRLSGRILDAVTDLLTPGRSRRRTPRSTFRPSAPVDPVTAVERSARHRSIAAKQRGPQYETRIRYAVADLDTPAGASADASAGDTAGDAARRRDVLRGRAHALASALSVYSEHNYYRRARLRRPLPAIAGRRLRRGDLLSVDELAALAHLPVDEFVPGLVRAGAKAVAPPPGIPVPGPGVKPLGVADTGPARRVGLAVADARQHLHVLGATGTGKSTLLARMILDDAAAGRGGVVIDPRGDLISDLLDRLPAATADRVVLFDADDRRRPPCLNPLDVPAGSSADATVDNLVSVFSRVFSASWGPRTDDILRAACLTLTTAAAATGRPATLLDLPRLLTDPDHRARVLTAVTDPVLAGFWAWYDQLGDPARAQVIAPLMNKLRAFLLRPFVRAALAAGPSTVDLGAVLDGGLLLARIPKGSLGTDTCRLVGSLLVARTWQAATARARVPQHRRRDSCLVIDECHNFLNLAYPLEDLLAEARGYRLSMVLAHQNLAQLPTDLAEGISANARSKVFFAASPTDARHLARHTAPRLGEHDLAHLEAYRAAARLVVDGAQTPAFTLATEPLAPPVPGRARHIRAAARAHTHPAAPPRPAPPAAGRPADPRRVAEPPRPAPDQQETP